MNTLFSPKGFISTWIITHIAVYLERWDSIHVLFTVQVIWHLCYVTRVISPLTLSPHYKAHRCNWRASLFRFTLTWTLWSSICRSLWIRLLLDINKDYKHFRIHDFEIFPWAVAGTFNKGGSVILQKCGALIITQSKSCAPHTRSDVTAIPHHLPSRLCNCWQRGHYFISFYFVGMYNVVQKYYI